MTARTRPPRAQAISFADPAGDPHYAIVDPATGRILSMASPAMATMSAAARAALNMQPIPREHALAFYADPFDRSWTNGQLGRCTPQPLRLITEAKGKRAKLLSATDYLMLGDAPGITVAKLLAWKAYRQALRDITKQPDYPQTITWPTPPT